MSITQVQARDRLFNILGEQEGGDVYDTDFINEILDEVEFEICAGRVKSPTGEMSKAPYLDFLTKKAFFDSHSDVYIKEDITPASTTIEVSEANYMASSGTIEIERDVITYTGITDDTLTGVTGISLNHKTGANVTTLIAYPTDILNDINIFLGDDEDGLEFQNTRGEKNQLRYWTEIIDENDNKFIKIVGQEDETPITIVYQKEPVGLVTLNTVPDRFYLKTVCKMASGRMLSERGEVDEGNRIEAMGFNEVKKMYDYYRTKNTNFRPKIEVKAIKTLQV